MKLALCITAIYIFSSVNVYSQLTPGNKTAPKESTLLGFFVGTTPCGETVRPMHRVQPKTNCDIILWELTLYQDVSTGSPTTYTLNSVCRFYINNRESKIVGTNTGLKGKWTIVKGTKNNPGAVVYKLSDEKQVELLFLKVDDNLLHPLSMDKSLMVGNSGWSYTLSKTDH